MRKTAVSWKILLRALIVLVTAGCGEEEKSRILSGRLLRNCMEDERIPLVSCLEHYIVFVTPIYLEFVA